MERFDRATLFERPLPSVLLPEQGRCKHQLGGLSSKVSTPSTSVPSGSPGYTSVASLLPTPSVSPSSAALVPSQADPMQRTNFGGGFGSSGYGKSSCTAIARGWYVSAETPAGDVVTEATLGHSESNASVSYSENVNMSDRYVGESRALGPVLQPSVGASGLHVHSNVSGIGGEILKEKLAWTLQYQPRHHFFVLAALRFMAHRLWTAQERLKRRCLWEVLRDWHASLAQARLDSRLLDAESVLRKRVERARREADMIAASTADAHVNHRWSSRLQSSFGATEGVAVMSHGVVGDASQMLPAATSSSLVSVSTRQVPPGDVVSRQRNVAADTAEDRARTLEQHLAAVQAARKASSGAARLLRPLRRASRRQIGACAARWKDFARPPPLEGRLAAEALCRGAVATRGRSGNNALDRACPAFRWRVLGAATSEESLEECLARSARERFTLLRCREEVAIGRRAGARLLNGTLLSCASRAITQAFSELRDHAADPRACDDVAVTYGDDGGSVDVPNFGARTCVGRVAPPKQRSERARDSLPHQRGLTSVGSDWDDGESDFGIPAASQPAALATSSAQPSCVRNACSRQGIARFGLEEQEASNAALFGDQRGFLSRTPGTPGTLLVASPRERREGDDGSEASGGGDEDSNAPSWTSMDGIDRSPVFCADDERSRCPSFMSVPSEHGVLSLLEGGFGLPTSMPLAASGRPVMKEPASHEGASRDMPKGNDTEEEQVSHCAQILLPPYQPAPRKSSSASTMGDPAVVMSQSKEEELSVHL